MIIKPFEKKQIWLLRFWKELKICFVLDSPCKAKQIQNSHKSQDVYEPSSEEQIFGGIIANSDRE